MDVSDLQAITFKEKLKIKVAKWGTPKICIYKTFSLWPFIVFLTGGRLTEIHLIEIVFFQLIKTFIIS